MDTFIASVICWGVLLMQIISCYCSEDFLTLQKLKKIQEFTNPTINEVTINAQNFMRRVKHDKVVARCSDKYRFCDRIEKLCLNEEEYPAMSKICPQTCNRCPKETSCMDRLPDAWCELWTGHCHYNYVSFVCPKTCKTCSCPDLVFLVDGSMSEATADFLTQKKFLKLISASVDLATYQVALVTFGENINVEFDLQSHHTVQDLQIMIDSMAHPGAGDDSVNEALSFAIKGSILNSERFHFPCNKRTVLLLTGANSLQNNDWKSITKLAKRHNVNLNIITVGENPHSIRPDFRKIQYVANVQKFSDLLNSRLINKVARHC